MFKKLLSVFFAVLICFSFAINTFALSSDYVTVSTDIFITDDKVYELNKLAQKIEKNYGYKICCDLTENMGVYLDVKEYAKNVYAQNAANKEGGIFVYSSTANEAYFYCTEKTEKVITADVKTSIYAAFEIGKSYYEGVKKLYEYCEEAFEAIENGKEAPTISTDDIPGGMVLSIPSEEDTAPRCVTDRASILRGEYFSKLNALFIEKTNLCKCQFAVITVESLGESDINTYAKEIYETGGYGYDNSNNGVLIVVNDKTCTVVAGGKAKLVFNGISKHFLMKSINKKIADMEYYSALSTFAESFSTLYRDFTFIIILVVAAVLLIALAIFIIIRIIKKKKAKNIVNNEETSAE